MLCSLGRIKASAGSPGTAFTLLCDTLNQVESELSDILFGRANWQTDGLLKRG